MLGCIHWKIWECRKHWGIDELQLPAFDMSFTASEITGLNSNEAAIINDSSKSGLSRRTLLLLLGEHPEISYI
jgi:hypothetical protein